MSFNLKVQGVNDVMNDFTKRGLVAQVRADKVTETYTRKMANESAELAPVDSGDLRANLIASPHRISTAVWEYGGTLPYSRRQEYENLTHKGFIRKSLWNNRTPYREAIRREVRKR